mmetsp:Transcript_27567/g.63490  ORF Transcript_27567/g.63490 Transcript_27567/m.63490 type:complete len:120 (+) Transcript_27567:524-883(+)
MVQMIVRPDSASFCKIFTTLKAEKESRPEVGSSKKRTSGLEISSTPMAVRFFSPPETPGIMMFPMKVLAHLVSSSLSIVFSTSSSRSAGDTVLDSLSAAEKRKASRGVSVANSASSCIT